MTANTLYKNSCHSRHRCHTEKELPSENQDTLTGVLEDSHTEKELPSENQDTLTGVLEDSEHRLCIAIKAGGIAERGCAPVTPIMKEDSFFET